MGVTKVQFRKLRRTAVDPRRGTPHSAGIDLATDKSFGIKCGERLIITTGLTAKLPKGTYGKLEPRSGLAAKFGIDPAAWFLDGCGEPVLAGVIDCDYRGELKIVLVNTGSKYAAFKAGEYVAQMIVRDYVDAEIEMVFGHEFDETDRGDGGFGSTDK